MKLFKHCGSGIMRGSSCDRVVSSWFLWMPAATMSITTVAEGAILEPA